MTITKQLELQFKSQAGTSKKIVISNPADNLTQAEVAGVMDHVVANPIFQDGLVNPYQEAVAARYITRQVDEVYTAI
ncbi:DUF2922 domain-containing protein [Hutsoniella sourekii]|uniref:DUF2922 domain-containing protein n=1 Tax=Hutsoniella sourekii TaxID=87650 RepID=UPI0004B8C331|nr:DUF2922 domain-containing protein [Hutsoniella sourekii]